MLTGCDAEVTNRGCLTSGHETYSGVALALDSGAATFATETPYCPFVVTGTDALADKVFAAWKDSPYEGDIRPIYIYVDGEIKPNKNAELAPWFEVTNVREVSVSFSDAEAQKAFKLRMALELPARKRGAPEDDPEKRVQLTD